MENSQEEILDLFKDYGFKMDVMSQEKSDLSFIALFFSAGIIL